MFDWNLITRIGGYEVYNLPPSRIKLFSGCIVFGNHQWKNVLTHAVAGEEVFVYIPFGALSGLNKCAVVVLNNGKVEVWAKEK